MLKPYVDAGAAWARYFLAQIVERAVPAPKDAGVRLKGLLEPAAERGLADAQWMLGTMYLRGAPGITKDPSLAEALLRRAAERGNPGAAFQLGVALLSGTDGISRDERDGLVWVTRAAARGQKEAQELLKSARDSLPAGSGLKPPSATLRPAVIPACRPGRRPSPRSMQCVARRVQHRRDPGRMQTGEETDDETADLPAFMLCGRCGAGTAPGAPGRDRDRRFRRQPRRRLRPPGGRGAVLGTFFRSAGQRADRHRAQGWRPRTGHRAFRRQPAFLRRNADRGGGGAHTRYPYSSRRRIQEFAPAKGHRRVPHDRVAGPARLRRSRGGHRARQDAGSLDRRQRRREDQQTGCGCPRRVDRRQWRLRGGGPGGRAGIQHRRIRRHQCGGPGRTDRQGAHCRQRRCARACRADCSTCPSPAPAT